MTVAATPSAERGIVRKRGKKRKGKRTVREHIRQDCEFVMERCTTPDEPMDGGVDRTLGQPLGERIKQQLGTPVRVLPPSVQLVVDRKRDTLLESAVGVRGPPNNITLFLQSQGHVKVLRDIMFRPNFLFLISRIHEHRVLNGRPPEKTKVTARCQLTQGKIRIKHVTHALCPTNGATSPFAQAIEMHLFILRVKYARPFSK